MLAKAIAIAAAAFKNKLDKGGRPYILHCLRVMNNARYINPNDEDLMCIAVLHDLLEDCDDEWSAQRLRDEGFSDRVISALELLTHIDGDYDMYIKVIAFSDDARSVKLADLVDNSDITRIKGLRKKDMDRLEKYHRAYTYLS